MNKITLDYIDSFKPCTDGRLNLIDNYGEDFNYSTKQFLNLKHIPYDDKIWLVTKVINIKTLQRWALACARSVAHNYPNNGLDKILDDIEVAIETDDKDLARSAAWSAAWSAWSAESAAWSAARSAELAARSAELAELAELAARSARSAAYSAAELAGAAESNQEKLNIKLLKELL